MIIFFYGEDNFRSNQKLLEIKQKYLASDKSGSGLSLFDFEEKKSAEEIINIFGIPNLLAPKRLVVVKNIISAGALDEQKKITEYLKKNKNIFADLDLVVVFLEKSYPPKSNGLFKLLLSREEIKKQDFSKLEGKKIGAWILRRMKEIDEKTSISKEALEKLVVYVGPETGMLENEINKLVSYAGGQMITDKDIELLIKPKIDGNIFSAIDSIGAGNKKQAIVFLRDNLEKGDDPFYIFSMIIYQFRNMIRIADLVERGINSEYEISRETKMHPFVIRKTLNQARIFPFEKLKKIYNKLARFDAMVKTGKMDMKLALDKFVAEL